MRIVLHRHVPGDSELRTQWNALIEQMESPEVFYTHEWAGAMQQAYGPTLVPFLVLVYEAEKLVGVASLATDPEARTASFLAGTTADYCEFLSHPGQREMLAETVFSELSKAGIQRIELANLPADSATADAIGSAARKCGYRVFFRPAYSCAQVDLGAAEARANLKSSHLRKSMFRRSMGRLGKDGRVVLAHARSWSEVEAILNDFFVAHVARFLATGRISNLARAARRRFLEELAKNLSSSGWMTLTRLMVGDRAIAWNYGFQFEGSWFWYQPTFDSRVEALSPGYCLLTNIVSEACDLKEMRVVDLGLGAEGYKDRFANSTRATLHGTLTKSLASHWTALARYRIACGLKSSPQLETLARGAMRRVDSARGRLRASGLGGLLAWGIARLRRFVSSRDEVFFYEWPREFSAAPGSDGNSAFHLAPMVLETLAAGAIRYEEDTETRDYLLRSARRFRGGKNMGFALQDSNGNPVHFCWVSAFEGFYMDELQLQLETPSPMASLIFDCWTPRAVRGHNYYAMAIARLAQELVREGRDPWIFSASTNDASIRGLKSSGFERQFSMVRRKFLMGQRVTKLSYSAPRSAAIPVGS